MPLTAANAKRGLDAKINGAVRLRIFTANYGTELAVFTIAFSAATATCPSVATVGSTPIAGTWAANGTAGSYRVTNADASTTYWEHTGATAVAASGSPHALLSSTAAVSGATVSLNSFTMAEVCTIAGE
ncbi:MULTISPECIES: hypothetical protein [Cyanophyceae]|uniref:hypothetical protein n=1 Tax=Cyanophyceae TaxID=3028117 RepID=UPI00168668DC|nr:MULTISPECIES: hypothetical protein [Cyanophyceae]MBD1918845.1 hypothetical protein [Phormidium sp. FACHB-77]MBD2033312.1 hypothetical protein [Phormidium sp. FACHB-322]MBD2053755.1 hypothetical protein [Leptolyngbya sp. FACHB-60]